MKSPLTLSYWYSRDDKWIHLLLIWLKNIWRRKRCWLLNDMHEFCRKNCEKILQIRKKNWNWKILFWSQLFTLILAIKIFSWKRNEDIYEETHSWEELYIICTYIVVVAILCFQMSNKIPKLWCRKFTMMRRIAEIGIVELKIVVVILFILVSLFNFWHLILRVIVSMLLSL